jgi:hypothetical protein
VWREEGFSEGIGEERVRREGRGDEMGAWNMGDEIRRRDG